MPNWSCSRQPKGFTSLIVTTKTPNFLEFEAEKKYCYGKCDRTGGQRAECVNICASGIVLAKNGYAFYGKRDGNSVKFGGRIQRL